MSSKRALILKYTKFIKTESGTEEAATECVKPFRLCNSRLVTVLTTYMTCMRKWTPFHKVWRIANFFWFSVFRLNIQVSNNEIRLYILEKIEGDEKVVRDEEKWLGVNKTRVEYIMAFGRRFKHIGHSIKKPNKRIVYNI